MGVSALAFGVASCQPDDFNTPNQANIALASMYEDAVNVNVTDSNYVFFSFDPEYAKGIMPVWNFNGTYIQSMKTQKFYSKAGDYSVEVKIANANGISDGSIVKNFHIDRSIMTGFAGFKADSEYNMWKGVKNEITYWYAPGWAQISDPKTVEKNGSYTVSLPSATTDQWQAQMAFHNDLTTSAEKHYDFSIILTSSNDHPGVTVKLCQEDDDNLFYFADRVTLKANTPTCYWKSDMEGLDITKMKLVLDFGGNPADTEIDISSIVLKDHANDDGTVVPEIKEPVVDPISWVDVNSAENLWSKATFDYFFYYAPGWEQLDNPTVNAKDNSYTFALPSATSDQWQAQFAMKTTNVSTSASKNYDFKVVLLSTQDIKGATVKLVLNGDDNIFYFTDRIDLKSNEEYVFTKADMPGIDMEKVNLFFDFGGNPAETEITISNIILQEHKSISWDASADNNLWNSMTYENFFYYAPGWSQLPDPKVTVEGNSYTIELPSATSDQWQAQVAFKTNMSTSASKKYDFHAAINSNQDLKGITIKLVLEGDDNKFYFTDRVDIKAYEEFVYTQVAMDGIDMEKVNLFFDFGGNPADTEVTISDVILRVSE